MALPQKIDAPLGKTLLLLQHVMDGDAFLKAEMRLMRAAKDVLPFVLVDKNLGHGIVPGRFSGSA
jgi:hypothetical protein